MQQNVVWVSASAGAIPELAISAGYDKQNKLTKQRKIYIVRGEYSGHLIPGKLVQGLNHASIGFDGKEIHLNDYEVLLSPRKELEWVLVDVRSIIPNNAVLASSDPSSGIAYYIGRALHEDTLTPGKVPGNQSMLYIPFGGYEHILTRYEILVERRLLQANRRLKVPSTTTVSGSGT